MPKSADNELTHQEFWSRMEKNSLVVERMPGWVKGSPVNKRTQTATEATDEKMSTKPAPSVNR